MKPMQGRNLLVSNFDRYFQEGNELIAVVYIVERYNYTPIMGEPAYHHTVRARGDRERVREAVKQALEYAREHGLPVQVNNPHVKEDLAAGYYDVTGIEIVDSQGAPI
jgi:hypothetical protein